MAFASKLSKEATLIKTLVAATGCISKSQALILCKKIFMKEESSFNLSLDVLNRTRSVSIHDNVYITPFGSTDINRDAINTVWYIIEKIASLQEEGSKEETIDNRKMLETMVLSTRGGNSPVMSYFIADNELIDIIPCSISNIEINIQLAMREYEKLSVKERPFTSTRVFLFDNEENQSIILDTFKEKTIDFPFEIVFINHMNNEITEVPEIDIFEP